MPCAEPPESFDGAPNRYVLRRGTQLWRIHRACRPSLAFNPHPVSILFGGARFDATPQDRYPFWYAAIEEETSLCEVLMRDVAGDERGDRVIPHAAVADKTFSALTVTADLALISLITGDDLAAIGQDSWLVDADGNQYAQTRAWGHWLRRQAEWACGIAWSSHRNRGGTAIVLFGDRCAAAFGTNYEQAILYEIPPLAVFLGDEAGARWLTGRFRKYRIGVAPPAAYVAGPAAS
jgi:hypothetical protein